MSDVARLIDAAAAGDSQAAALGRADRTDAEFARSLRLAPDDPSI